MAETTEKEVVWEMTEDIVISGISGRFPESDNIDELAKNLLDNVDMITEDDRRWPIGLYGLPTRSGKIKDLSKFDAQFFGVHGKQANLMDPQARLLLELTYEALCDAGMNPQTLRGTRTGVYVGACVSEVEEGLAQDVSKVSGYALTGCSRSMFANRISYTFDFQGPSYAMDTACSSSFIAFQQAILGMRAGQCERAFVGGVNICLRPVTALQFHKLNMLSNDGKCKHMDASADGYVRSEACAVIFLQKLSEAKRIYATVVHAKTNTDGYKKEGITYPSGRAQRELMEEVCKEAKINPHDVLYVEAHGTGTKVGDPVEIGAITDVYCKGRKTPLLIGGVKSNLGHSEPSSGLCSLAKVLIAFENKCIPANLHFSNANPSIEALKDGTIKPVIENTPFNGGIVAINSFGFGGVNVHAIIKSHDKNLTPESYEIVDKIPRLVNMCGRTEQSVNYVFDFIQENKQKVTREFLALINEISKISSSSSGMNYRGTMLIKKTDNEADNYSREVMRVPEKRPLWFVFSGMGSQWPAMAKGLMSLEIFAKAIHYCAEILKPFGVDLLHLLLEEDEAALDTIVAPFVCIAAVQIGLIDVLRACGIEPDGIVGHSVGELGCAYADRCYDARGMILSAYWRGKCVENHKVERGLMAAVGMTWEDCLKRCPKGVVPACHNAEDSVTISGPYEATKQFVAQLKAENIFAREVKSCDIAFHSPYVGPIGPELKKKLADILPPPTLRSSKWISSSVPEDRWNEDTCRYSTPDYYVNNLTSPVLFHGATKYLPKNGIMIEIAPHTLLQAILKRSLGADMTYIGLMKRGNNDNNLDFFMQALGKLYQLGLNPAIENLYPKVPFPVPRGTQSTGSLIKWDHSQNWLVTQYPEYFNPSSSSDYVVKVNLQEAEDQYLAGHNIDGRVLYPATGYLMLAWKMLAKIKGQFHDKIPVEFENVTIHRATLLPKTGQVKFVIRMMETSGEFSISEGGAIVATGRVFVPEDPVLKMSHIVDENLAKPEDPNCLKLTSKDLYKELRVRGYDYGPTFQGLTEALENGRLGKVKWSGSWISFADACLQMTILSRGTRALFLPVRFQCVRCDPRVLLSAVAENPELPVAYDYRVNVCVTTGLEIKGVRCNIAPRKSGTQSAVLEAYNFIPHNEECALTKSDKQEVEEYIQVASTVTRKLLEANGKSGKEFMNGFKDASDDLVKRYLDADPTDFALLHTVNDINSYTNINSFEEKVKKGLLRHRRDLPKDILANVYLRERMIRPSLDIVSENSSKSLNVLEINASTVPMSSTVKNYLESSGANVNYTLAHPSPSDLGSAISADINVTEWNFAKTNAPSDLNNMHLVLFKDISTHSTTANGVDLQALLTSMYTVTKNGGFAMVFLRHGLSGPERFLYNEQKQSAEKRVQEFTSKATEIGFSIISRKSDGMSSTTILLRKVTEKNPQEQIILPISTQNYAWVEKLQTFLKEPKKAEGANIWLVANDESTNGIVGFVNCLRQEPNGERIRCIFNAGTSKISVNFQKSPFKEILVNDLAVNVYRDGVFGSYRHLSMGNIEEDGLCKTEHAYLNVVTRGDLSSLKWFASENKFCTPKTMKANETLCHVYYAPLNFRDIMLATGKLPPDALPGEMALQDCILGLEFAGRDSEGKRVMGMIPSKGLATTVRITDPDFVWPIPDNWTMEEASTVPVAYSTAYYSLIVRGGLEPGESVLIHSGSGGVGQAAISICLNMGCEVFTTVGSQEKREFLKKQFPQLKDRNFANSRNCTFEQHVLRQTKGRGVDVVLNSLSEEKLHASLRCLAQHGRFLEIGKYDLSQNNPIGMSAFLKNIAFHGILLDCLFDVPINGGPTAVAHKQMVGQLIQEGIKTGAVKPLVRTVFSAEEAEEAFRFMASGKHVGKVLLKIRNEENQKVVKATPITMNAISRALFNPEKCYVITGGLGGFGLELAFWMSLRGAKKIILTSRSGPRDSYQKLSLKRLRSQGINIVVSNTNVSTPEGAQKLIAEAKALGEVGGIFHLAMVLRDGLFENQSSEAFDDVCRTKMTGLYYLDKVTRQSCKELEYFVTFSSVSCGRGNAGQTNYGFANSAMERICEARRRDGLHGLAVQWGAIGDVGIVIEKMGDNETVIGSTVPQRLPSCFAALDRFLQSQFAVCSSLVRSDRKVEAASKSSHSLLEMVTKVLGLKNQSSLHPTITLAELGLDSLMGIEVKQTLERDYEVILSMSEIRSLTINQLKEISTGNTSAIKEPGNASLQIDIMMPLISIPTDVVIHLNDVKEGKPVFFLPPVDGVFDLITPLAKLMKRPVIGLNWTIEMKDVKSLEKAAEFYIKTCKSLDSDEKFDIVGYSFGSVIAFEMALQAPGSNVILLDGSPSHLMSSIQQYVKVKEISEEHEQVEALVLLLSQYVSIDYAKTKAELLEIDDVEARNIRATEIYLDNKGPRCEPEAIAFAAQAFYQKMKMMSDYRSSKKLEGDVFLIRAEELLMKNVDNSPVPQDYGISEVITGECAVRTFKGNHKTFLVNNLKAIASIMNEKLC